jgi:uncharacterized protein (DUF2164 family)
MSRDNPMKIKLSEERRSVLLQRLEGFYRELFDEEISHFRANELLDFFVKNLGPSVYNQAIQDARRYMQDRLEDLSAEFFEEDSEER